MSVLAPTPPERIVDAKGRPYFLWDEDLTLDAFRGRLADPDPEVRAYYLGKLMRQAKPDDVFTFASLREIRELFPFVVRYLGRTRAFWTWVLDQWTRPVTEQSSGSLEARPVRRHRSARLPAVQRG